MLTAKLTLHRKMRPGGDAALQTGQLTASLPSASWNVIRLVK